ncbi:unnamed protein product [Calypogeia fissa]
MAECMVYWSNLITALKKRSMKLEYKTALHQQPSIPMTAAGDGVKRWDLQKLKNFRSFAPYDSSITTNTVEFNFSGSYLAVGGSDIRIYQVASVKQEWNTIKTFPDLSGTGDVASVRF